MSAWPWLDRRAVAAWGEFEATGAAEHDRKEFSQRLSRPGWVTAYPPQIFSTAAVQETNTAALRLSELISSFPRRIFGDDLDAWARYLDIPTDDAQLMCEALRRPHLAQVATAFMRPDLVVTDQGLRLVELNVATSLGGLSTCAPYTAATVDSAYARHLAERGLQVQGPDTSQVWLKVFAGLVRRHGEREPGDGPLHVFEAAANPADVVGGRRFFADMIRSAGYDISSGLIHDLELSDDGVFFEGRRVDAIFTGYTWHETKRFVPPALTRRLMELDTAGKVDFIGSPGAALYDNKANLALLFDSRYSGRLTQDERDLVDTYVPTTLILRDDTLDRAVAEREELICKPASAYGGKNVAYGCVLTDDEWQAMLRERLQDATERYVLQQRVRPAVVDLPGTTPSEREMVLAPLVFGGQVTGIFVRHAPPMPDSTINASNGAEIGGALTIR